MTFQQAKINTDVNNYTHGITPREERKVTCMLSAVTQHWVWLAPCFSLLEEEHSASHVTGILEEYTALARTT